MKTPIILTVIILAAAAAIGWRDHQRLASVRIAHDHVVAEAVKRGISPDFSDGSTPVRATRRERENRGDRARLLAADYIGFSKEKETMRKNRVEPDEAFQQREREFQDRMKSLDPAQWEIVITEVCACNELPDDTRRGFLYNAIVKFADKHPEAALWFFHDNRDLGVPFSAEHVIQEALSSWSCHDPLAALEWARQNCWDSPELFTEATKRHMISGAAAQDPSIAFTVLGSLNVEKPEEFVSEIIHLATTSEKRTATLAALRGYLATIEDEKSRQLTALTAISSLAGSVTADGFDAATQWIAAVALTPEERVSFTYGLYNTVGPGHASKSEEVGRWIEWVGNNLPPAKVDGSVFGLIIPWTMNDYQAAGKWLATTPEGPAKNTAIRGYAQTVAQYDPDTAAQWAMTLPPGKDREQTLKNIHQIWPKDDPAGAAAFAKEHGIK